MLSYDPDLRPSVDEIKKHPWLSGPLPSEYEIFDELTIRHEINEKTHEDEK
jgi:hypothetical protein